MDIEREQANILIKKIGLYPETRPEMGVLVDSDKKLDKSQYDRVTKMIEAGYKGYKIMENFGVLSYLFAEDNLKLIEAIDKLKVKLNDQESYYLLPLIRYFYSDSGITRGYSAGTSMPYDCKFDSSLFAELLSDRIKGFLELYTQLDLDSELIVVCRIWLTDLEYDIVSNSLIKEGITARKMQRELNQILKDKINTRKSKRTMNQQKKCNPLNIKKMFKKIFKDIK